MNKETECGRTEDAERAVDAGGYGTRRDPAGKTCGAVSGRLAVP